MKIGDRCFVHGYVDEIRKDTVIVRNKGGYFGHGNPYNWKWYTRDYEAWMPSPAPYTEEKKG